MKEQLIFNVKQGIEFVWLALLKLMIGIRHEISRLLKYQKIRFALLVVLVLAIIMIFAFAPSIDGGTGGGGG